MNRLASSQMRKSQGKNALKILLIGKEGQVGRELKQALSPLGQVTATGRKELDLTDHRALQNAVRRNRPDLVINAAAYTAVDRAEEEAELAMAVNAVAPGVLAREAALTGALLVHYSTDYVFDGSKKTPYTEEDPPNPLNLYGKSKLAGEEAVRESEAYHLIFRTAWVYGLRGKNFLTTIMRLAQKNRDLRVVDDQHGAPTWCRTVALVTARILASAFTTCPRVVRETYHLTAGGRTTWYGFARAIADHLHSTAAVDVNLKAIPTKLYPTAATRPPLSLLSCTKLEQAYGIELPRWDQALGGCLLEANRAYLAALVKNEKQ